MAMTAWGGRYALDRGGGIEYVSNVSAAATWQLLISQSPLTWQPRGDHVAGGNVISHVSKWDPLADVAAKVAGQRLRTEPRSTTRPSALEQRFISIVHLIVGLLRHFVSWLEAFACSIHSLSQSRSPLSECYHKFNALWRQYDSLVNLPNCICENSEKLKKHNQLLKLMKFLMALDEVYAPIRSIILTTDPIPDVKGAFATLSRDESHRSTQSYNVSKTSNGNTAFVARTNFKNGNSAWSNSNNQSRKLNKPNLVCTHCNMNGHTADRCFELVGYPPNFKRNTGTNRGSTSNNVVSGNKDQSSRSSNSFTYDQYRRLMTLISEKSGTTSIKD
ncbi:hypothetical protein Tco_0935528 [Tanacetum coccineum]